jgi:polysaccharide export outer membrane protein
MQRCEGSVAPGADHEASEEARLRIAAVAWLNLACASTAIHASAQATSVPAARQAPADCDGQSRSTYLLGPDDEVEMAGPEADDPSVKSLRIDGDGEIQVPLVGRVHVAGLTVQEAQHELEGRLSTYIRDPQITLTVKELRSQPVSILGAVNAPGLHQVRGYRTLLEMLSSAGGLRADAAHRISITRRREWGCIPLPSAAADATGQFVVAEVSVTEIVSGRMPEGNIQILPHDVISVPRAEMVYVIGDVKRSGGFVIGENESMSVLQVLSLAEGMNGTADKRRARILRREPGGQRAEIAVDVKAILAGKSEDVMLHADDILFIPGSAGKKASLRALETAIQTGTGLITGLLIWR